ncbi:MAG: helix-turn-helix domain-containing protein [Chloroflexi bacterium]|nr:helix-turn-helix domain-containing protein [Chloroflexota bacterium]
MTQNDGPQYSSSIGNRQGLLELIPADAPIGYLELRRKTTLSSTDLDGALSELEDLGVIVSKQTTNQVFYRRVWAGPGKEWYSVVEAAQYLSVSKRTVQQLIRDGQMVAYRVGRGGHHRIRRADLDSPMHRNDSSGIAELNGAEDPVLAELWDNEQDAEYDRL